MKWNKVNNLLLKGNFGEIGKKFLSICKKQQKPPSKNPTKVSEDCHTVKEVKDFLNSPDPDLTFLDGDVYKTCGFAYVVQKPLTPERQQTSNIEKILNKIEAHHELKMQDDKMPPFEDVPKRLMDLNERGLHPFYKMYQSIPKNPRKRGCNTTEFFEVRGRCNLDQVPLQLDFNKELLDKKNLYYEVKRVQLPIKLSDNVKNKKSGNGTDIIKNK